MATLRVQVVESEKSPEVLQANWREKVILNRNLQVINRSQNTVVNRITIDQKIINKRFQKKLQQSKTAYAKITGNKNLEIAMRQKHTFVLNTNLGQGEADDANLQRIWTAGNHKVDRLLNRGRKSIQRAFSAPAPGQRLPPQGGPIIITLSASELGLQVERPAPRYTAHSPLVTPPTSQPGSRRPSTSVNPPVSISVPTPGPRPNTVAAAPRRGRAMSDVTGPTASPDPEGGALRVAFADEESGLGKRTTSESNLATTSQTLNQTDDSNKGEFFKTMPNCPTPAPSSPPKPPTRQSSRSGGGGSRGGGGGGLGMSMFEGSGEADITLLDIHRLRTRSANYTGRVNTFCARLREMRNERGREDYYSSRLIDYAQAGGRNTAEWRLPGTPEAETLREMGDVNVRSLTFRNLNRNAHVESQSQIVC